MAKSVSIREVHETALQVFPVIRDETVHLLSQSGNALGDADETIRMMFRYQSERSQAVSFLLSHDYPWDAEIVLRSFYECTAKIVFICSATKNDRSKLISEFRSDLSVTNHRRTSRKAEFAKRAFKDEDKDSIAVFEFLQNPKLFPTESDKNKAARKALENKWSFSEIIEHLSKIDLDGWHLTDIKSLLHMYGMASHLVHADQSALDLMLDRELREPNERALLECSHICRILSDQIHLAFFSAEALRIAIGAKYSDKEKLATKIREFNRISAPLHLEFANSQRDFYAAPP